MSKLYLPIGIFGSGKSTWAREQNAKIVGGDNIRYMLSGGKYIFDPVLEHTVLDILYDVTQKLLEHGYDVILDECYCGLTARQRHRVAQAFNVFHITAVIFPVKGMGHHVLDKVKKGLRGKTPEYWTRVYEEMMEVYEPIDLAKEYYFNGVINV